MKKIGDSRKRIFYISYLLTYSLLTNINKLICPFCRHSIQGVHKCLTGMIVLAADSIVVIKFWTKLPLLESRTIGLASLPLYPISVILMTSRKLGGVEQRFSTFSTFSLVEMFFQTFSPTKIGSPPRHRGLGEERTTLLRSFGRVGGSHPRLGNLSFFLLPE